MRMRIAGPAACWIALCVAAAPGVAQEAAGCATCHDQKLTGAHTPVACATCHQRHEQYPHPQGAPKPKCASCHEQQAHRDAEGVHAAELRKGNAATPECATCHGAAHEVVQTKSAAFRTKVPETCGMCHNGPATEFQNSVHGRAVARGVTDAPVCTDCHGTHSIQRPANPASPVNARHIRETCGSCHGNVRLMRRFGLPSDRLVSFDASFHGMAGKGGSLTVANCASCHGVHNILASSDPQSTIHVSKVAATCGQCHPGAGKRFAVGAVHVSEGKAEAAPVAWVRGLYGILIPTVIGLMLLHNAGDFARKLWRKRFSRAVSTDDSEPAPAQAALRMLPLERVQHALLVISFTVLAWTGFALQYPDHWWAHPLLLWEDRFPLRSWVHRIAAVVFVAAAVFHVTALFTSRSLRQHWRELVPHREDMVEAWRWMRYHLGLGPRPPARSSHSYIEKAEYWAVVWGGVIMAVTGWMLWANNFTLRWLPKWAIEVATALHFYEAVLATLAILVWHFYFVIFDPEVYPMDSAWLTGKSARERE